MQVDVLRGVDWLSKTRDNWDAVYAADPDAHFFLSSTWMWKWLAFVQKNSFVLAARSDGDTQEYCAFLPLTFQVSLAKGGGFYSVMRTAGEGMADCAGLLCHPDVEEEAIAALARQIKEMGWRDIVLKAFRASDERMQILLRNFPRKQFKSQDFKDIYHDGTDHSIFPYVDLRPDWDDYLSAKLTSDSRRKVRRFLRQVEESSDLRITQATAETLDRDLEVLFRFWWEMWGSDRMKPYVKLHDAMLRHCHEQKTLFLTVLWLNDRPLGALANLLDDTKKVMLFKIMSRDQTFKNPSPNFVLYANSIRHAIEIGYKTCEFLQGNHRFKYSFGAEDMRVHQKIVSRCRDRPTGSDLDRSNLLEALQQNEKLHRQGRLAEAERGYRQILRMDPLSQLAATGLKQLEIDRGRPIGR